MSKKNTGWVFAIVFCGLAALQGFLGCSSAEDGGDGDDEMDAGVDGDTDSDSDGDADTDSDADTDTGADADAGDAGADAIEMDCSSCPSQGGTLENMTCAFDLCDETVVVESDYESKTGIGTTCTLEDTYQAVAHFGATTNGLAPKLNDSYALMASGPAEGTAHSVSCDDYSIVVEDPWSDEGYDIHDVMEWRLILQAPQEAKAFRFKYVFFSEEYDEFISTVYNDKFYVVLEAGSTNDGNPTVINFTDCRSPGDYWDFVCEADDESCEPGQKYCYIAINSAFSDCCWYESCPDGYSYDVGTDISGTGFECAASQTEDSSSSGSSTGWLQTSWPIDGGETFAVTFHIHDTSDGVYDSEVILDAFEFLKDPDQGTVVVE